MYVYFIKTRDNAQLIKVGKAADVQKRLSQLQTGNAAELKLIGVIECRSDREALELERRIHSVFRDLRVRGEWFRCNQNFRNFIAASCSGDEALAKRSLSKYRKQEAKKHYKKNKSIVSIKGQGYDFNACKRILTAYLGLDYKEKNTEFFDDAAALGYNLRKNEVIRTLMERALDVKGTL